MSADLGPVLALGALVVAILTGASADASVAAIALVVGAAGLAASAFTRPRTRVALATCAIAALGVGVSARAANGARVTPLAPALHEHAAVTLRGTVTSDPAGANYATSALVRVDLPGGRHRTVLARATGDNAMHLAQVDAGDRVVLTGRITELGSTGTDNRARWRHAVARLVDARVEALTPPRGLLRVANALRDRVLRGTRALSPTPRALVAGFLLGDTRAVPADLVGAYRDSGLSHLLAVSGENVAFVLALTGPLLRRLRLPGRTVLALGVIVVFTAMTRFEPSVLRAAAMASLAVLTALLGRPVARGRVLAYAVIGLLLIDPFLLHSVAFLLSCGASAGIVYAEPVIARHLPGPNIVREPLAVSLAAQLGVLPVLLATFGSFPLVTPVANVFAAPAAELVGVYGFLAAAIASLVPALGPLVQAPTALLVTWISSVARAGAAVPVELHTRTTLGIVAIGAGAASVACARGPRHRRDRAVPDSPPR